MPLPARRLPILLTCAVLAACGTPSLSPSPSVSLAPSAASPPGGTPVATAAPTVPPTPAASDDAIAPDPPPLALEEVATGLASPINITATPDGLLLVNERDGRVVTVDPAGGPTAVALDISDRVLGGGEQGLLGLALHPDWPATPRAYVHYTDRNGDTVLSELSVTDLPSPPALDATTERVLLRVEQPYANHNGGQLAFGPDGYLYVALGDGGAGGDPHGHGQDPTTLLGSILRIDVDAAPPDGGDDGAGYGIPSDNPFADGTGGAPEVFVYGLRNPWRFSFDRSTGELWIADVGQSAYEEIDRLDPATDAGANLGWAVMEGAHCYADLACSSDGLVQPVAEYGRDQGCSVTGGYVYRGTAIPDLRGWYLFSDYCSGLLFGVPSDVESAAEPRVLLETGASVSTFGQDADGELYLADLASGAVYRIVEG
jgi:glucose/arabinose dehydrogenase